MVKMTKSAVVVFGECSPLVACGVEEAVDVEKSRIAIVELHFYLLSVLVDEQHIVATLCVGFLGESNLHCH